MHIDDMIMVSVDDHVVESPDLFDEVPPTRLAELAPKIEVDEAGICTWRYNGDKYRSVGLNAVAGRVEARARVIR
jgi:hypothetical protein